MNVTFYTQIAKKYPGKIRVYRKIHKRKILLLYAIWKQKKK